MSIGLLIGHKVVGMKMILEDGVSHSVDSSENAFKAAAMGAVRACEWEGGWRGRDRGEGRRGREGGQAGGQAGRGGGDGRRGGG